MEIIIEVPALGSGWFELLSEKVAEAALLDKISMEEVRPPPASFGSNFTTKLHVGVTLSAELAAVVHLLVALHGEYRHEDSPQAPRTEYCNVRFVSDRRTIEMTVPCTPLGSEKIFGEKIDKAFSEFEREQPTVHIAPISHHAGSRKHGKH